MPPFYAIFFKRNAPLTVIEYATTASLPSPNFVELVCWMENFVPFVDTAMKPDALHPLFPLPFLHGE